MAKEKKQGQKKWDHEALEVAFLANGRDFDDTSKATGCPKNTLYQISKRKNWSTLGNAQRKLVSAREEIRAIDPAIVTSVSEIARTSFDDQREGFKTSMSHALAKTGEYIAALPADAIVASSRDIANVVSSAKVIYNLGGETSSASVSINLLNMDASMLAGQVKVSPSL
jgi:hypothetical protein